MDKSKLKRINKAIRAQGFDNNVLRLIPDIGYVRIKPDTRNKGYFITIIQEVIEAPDIIEYFTDRFNKRFSKRNTKNKIIFEGFSVGKNGQKDVSIIRFYYKTNLFEKSLL